jgi:hypothetical protein
MNMNVEVHRTRNSLKILWTNEAGDRWTVAKKFNLGTRILEGAEMYCSAASWPEVELDEALVAQELATKMDQIFITPAHFDMVQIEHGRHTDDGRPVWIRPPQEGAIYITRAPQGEKGN